MSDSNCFYLNYNNLKIKYLMRFSVALSVAWAEVKTQPTRQLGYVHMTNPAIHRRDESAPDFWGFNPA